MRVLPCFVTRCVLSDYNYYSFDHFPRTFTRLRCQNISGRNQFMFERVIEKDFKRLQWRYKQSLLLRTIECITILITLITFL